MVERYKVKIENEAEEDFDNILRYLLSSFSHGAAVNASVAIKEKIASLSKFPERHPIYHNSESRDIVYRYVIAKKVHRIIFTVRVEKLLVVVARMAHVKMPKEQVIAALEEE